MSAWFSLLGVIALLVLVLRYRHKQTSVSDQDILSATSKESKRELLARLRTERAVREAWELWQAQGWSENGMMHRAVLKRISELKGDLTVEERKFLGTAPPGLTKPPIRGHLRLVN